MYSVKDGPSDIYDVPHNLYVFHILVPGNTTGADLDLFPDIQGKRRSVKLAAHVAGSELRSGGESLTESVADLVKDFVPIAEARTKQHGVYLSADDGATNEPPFRPFLLGPGDIALMAKYLRANKTGVWMVPSDVKSFEPWWEAALRDWHDVDPVKFPSFPGWIEDLAWRTWSEEKLITAIRAEEERFAAVRTEHEEKIVKLSEALSTASDEDSALKRLLNGTGTSLQDVVRDVLRAFGYVVRDMDQEYPEREPREDFRITEDGFDDWMVIADATGVAKGAKGAKLQTLTNYVVQYLSEEGNAIRPRQWLIVNRLLDRDPLQRGNEIFRPDVLQPFASSNGLAVDTAALFVLYRAMQRSEVSGLEVREHLRYRTGELSTRDALDWVQSRQ